MRVAVIGGGRAKRESEAYAAAKTVGRVLAGRGHTVVFDGRGRVMKAACRREHRNALGDQPCARYRPTEAGDSVERRM